MNRFAFLMINNLYRTLAILIVVLIPFYAVCQTNTFRVNKITYQQIDADCVRVGYHITNGNSTTIGTALSEDYSGTIVIPSVVEFDWFLETRMFYYTPIEIDAYAFNNKSISGIVIPNTVKSIKKCAFSGCKNLKSIAIPSSVIEMGEGALAYCTMLEEIEIPSSITTLDWNVFKGCTNLKRVYLSDKLLEISSYAFSGCSSLKDIIIPNSVEKIGTDAFSGTNLLQVEIPPSVINLSQSFENCKTLVSVVIDENQSMRNMNTTFRYCSKLKHIYSKSRLEKFHSYSENFTDIASDAHLYVPTGTKSKYESTTGWKVPNIAEVLGDVLFILSNDDEVTEFMVTNIDKGEVQIGTNSFAAIPDEKTTYAIPSTITNTNGEVFKVVGIGNNAFIGCANLESLRIPQNVLKISSAFNGCGNLRSIYFDSRNPSDIEFESNCFDELPDDAFFYVPAGTKSRYEALGVIKNPSQIVESSPISVGDISSNFGVQVTLPVFLNCKEEIAGVQFKMTLPNGVSIQEKDGELNTLLTDRTEGMTVLGHKDPDAENSYLFLMFSLDGNSITGNEGAIMNVNLNVSSDVEPGKYDMIIEDVTLATSTFDTFCPAAASSELLIDESIVKTIDFADAKVKAICVSNWDQNGDGELDMIEAQAITSLNGAFYGKKEIATFEELCYFTGLTSLNSEFFGCSGLTSVVIPSSVTNIGNFDFYGCTALNSIIVDEENMKYDSRDNCNAIIESETNTLLLGCMNTIIPGSVVIIGENAFIGCSSLTTINIPNSITTIEARAFKNCENLTPVIIPNSVTTIGSDAFSYCRSLATITIYSSEVSIHQTAFSHCSSVLDVYCYTEADKMEWSGRFFPDSGWGKVIFHVSDKSAYKSKFPNAAVTFCGFTEKVYVDGVRYDIISDVDKTAKVVQDPVKYKGDIEIASSFVFGDVTYSVIEIDNYAFWECSDLTSITIPSSVISIGSSALKQCGGLTSIKVESDNPKYDSRNDCNAIIETSSNTLIRGCNSTVIPNSVTSIGNSAFESCNGLTSITLPNSVTSIGDYAFSDCRSLTSITIPNSINSIGQEAFAYCKNVLFLTSLINEPQKIPNNLFDSELYATITVYVPEGCIDKYKVTEGWNRFQNYAEGTAPSLAFTEFDVNNIHYRLNTPNSVKVVYKIGQPYEGDITIPASVTYQDYTFSVTAIDEHAFSNMHSYNSLAYNSNLKSVVIPASVTSIGDDAFDLCNNLTSITIPNSVTSIGSGAFNETAWYDNQPDGLVYAGKVAYKYKGEMPDNTQITLKDGTLGIARFAFDYCTGLTSVTFPNSVICIGDWAFESCDNLTSITIPNSVTSMGDGVFCDCSNLTSVTIMSDKLSIGNYALYYCNNLTSVKVNMKQPVSISDNVFYNASNAILYVPYGSKSAYQAADYWKEFKEIIEMPEEKKGDVNDDGKVSVTDVVTMMSYIIGENPENFNVYAADVNGDGYVTVADVVAVIDSIKKAN